MPKCSSANRCQIKYRFAKRWSINCGFATGRRRKPISDRRLWPFGYNILCWCRQNLRRERARKHLSHSQRRRAGADYQAAYFAWPQNKGPIWMKRREAVRCLRYNQGCLQIRASILYVSYTRAGRRTLRQNPSIFFVCARARLQRPHSHSTNMQQPE